MGIEIRKYEKRDFMQLKSIADDEWLQTHINVAYAMLMSDDTVSHCHIAILDGRIIGYIYGFVLPNGTLIPEFLYVCADYRHRGLGQMLLEEFEKSSGCNASMIFYHKKLHNYYIKQGYQCGENLEVAMKDLSPNGNGAV